MKQVKGTTFEEYEGQYKLLIGELEHESDRGCILICTSLLDGLLEETLANYLLLLGKRESVVKELFGSSLAPMHSFSSKTKFAYLFSIIDEWMFDDLNLIRKLRNDCAHQFRSVSFTDEHIMQKTEKLKGADHWVTIFQDKGGAAPFAEEKEKNRFIFSALYIHSFLARSTEYEMVKMQLSKTKDKLADSNIE